MEFGKETQKRIDDWLSGAIDKATKDEIKRLLKDEPKTLIDAFSTNLSFGTGGVRAVMGVGTNRLNQYTIAAAMQGLSNFLKQSKANPSILIGYDGRNNSRLFAEKSAEVLAGNGIKVFIFKELRPTPLVSFGCRFQKCDAAVMITASHNPPKYNGFKIYEADGGQLTAPLDQQVINEMQKIEGFNVKTAPLNHPLINWVQDEIDQAYLQEVNTIANYPEKTKKNASKIKIAYTNLHGTGITLTPKVLNNFGFTNVEFVEKQLPIDGNFTNAPSPNPEDNSALFLGIELMLSKNCDLLIATDPDADRVGVVVNHRGKAVHLTGNEVACLLVYHICEAVKDPKGACIKSIVTSELFKEIVNSFNMHSLDVLTGFKYIAEKIKEWEKSKEFNFIFGAEESCGYLRGTFVRDKDGISASALICEMALKMKEEGKTLIDFLHSLYSKYGVFRESLLSISLPEGIEGMNKMKSLMGNLRSNPPKIIANQTVEIFDDYSVPNTIKRSPLPKADMLVFYFTDQSKLVVRPSGTEPKIKIYAGIKEKNFSSIDEGIMNADKKIKELLDAMKELFR